MLAMGEAAEVVRRDASKSRCMRVAINVCHDAPMGEDVVWYRKEQQGAPRIPRCAQMPKFPYFLGLKKKILAKFN